MNPSLYGSFSTHVCYKIGLMLEKTKNKMKEVGEGAHLKGRCNYVLPIFNFPSNHFAMENIGTLMIPTASETRLGDILKVFC